MTKGEAVNWIINLSAAIGKIQHQDLWHYEQALSEIKDMLEAEPERKTGRWIKDEEQSREHTEPIFICSCCQNNSAWGTEERTRYCSFCGARMECEEE